MNQTLQQSVTYLVQLAGAGLLLFLILELKRKHQEAEQRWNKRQMLLQSELGKLRGAVADLQSKQQDSEVRAELDTATPGRPSGLNLNRRTQAIRLFRRGERPEQVSATLGLPPQEAELLLKVHRIVAGRSGD